jgi:hypothetical protein
MTFVRLDANERKRFFFDARRVARRARMTRKQQDSGFSHDLSLYGRLPLRATSGVSPHDVLT